MGLVKNEKEGSVVETNRENERGVPAEVGEAGRS